MDAEIFYEKSGAGAMADKDGLRTHVKPLHFVSPCVPIPVKRKGDLRSGGRYICLQKLCLQPGNPMGIAHTWSFRIIVLFFGGPTMKNYGIFQTKIFRFLQKESYSCGRIFSHTPDNTHNGHSTHHF